MERRGATIGLAIGILVACVLVLYPFFLKTSDYSIVDPENTLATHTASNYLPTVHVQSPKTNSTEHFYPQKHLHSNHVAKNNGTQLSVFKGREAQLNRAIIQALATREPQSTRELRKSIAQIKGMKHTSYSTANKRVRSLEQSGYVRKAEVKERPGGITNFLRVMPPKLTSQHS